MQTISSRALLLCLSLFFLCSCLTAGAVRAADNILPFKGTDLEGRQIDLNQTIGNKPIVLIFWASWCPSCVTEVPKINQLAAQYQARGMEFLGVNVGYNDSVERAKAFAQKTNMSYPSVFDSSGMISGRYMIQGVPTIIVTNKRGVIYFRNFGSPDITEDIFAKLMAD